MDYEEALLQVTDVLKAHNRYHMKAPDHEQAVKAIRDIVTPKGEWSNHGYDNEEDGLPEYVCPMCGKNVFENVYNYCPNCGADMRGDV